MTDNPLVIFGIDMETDVGSWMPEWRGLNEGTPKLLELFSSQNIEATFYFTGEAAQVAPDMLKTIDARGHEVGCHSLYHETVGEELFPLPGIKPLMKGEVKPRIEKATSIIEEILGRKPVSFRAPRLWCSDELMRVLESLRYISDASYPMFFYGKRLCPYHPSSLDWKEEGKMRILEIPNFADMTMNSTDKYHRDRDQWPKFRTEGGKVLLRKCESFIEFVRNKNLPPVLCFYFHPWEFVPIEKTYSMNEATVTFAEFLTKGTGDTAVEELKVVIEGLKNMDAEFITAKSLAEQWSK